MPIILKASFFIIVSFTIFYEYTLQVIEPKYIQVLYFFLFFCALPFIFLYTKKSRLDRFIGELSYPVYIVHMLMIEVCKVLNVPKGTTFTALAITLSVLFAVLINKLLNDKIEIFRQGRVGKIAAVSYVSPL
jgi:peptidoglycan/LPS O-acetylase OafA/YrhL